MMKEPYFAPYSALFAIAHKHAGVKAFCLACLKECKYGLVNISRLNKLNLISIVAHLVTFINDNVHCPTSGLVPSIFLPVLERLSSKGVKVLSPDIQGQDLI